MLASCRKLDDRELTARLERVCAVERRVTAVVVAHLAEFDARDLCAGQGFPSLFAYCLGKLGMSEYAAYKRIAAARAVRRFPEIIEWLADGRVHLSAIAVLAPHFREGNVVSLLEQAVGKSKYELERFIAVLNPRPDKRDIVRTVPPRPSPIVGELSFAASSECSVQKPAPTESEGDSPPPSLPPCRAARQRVKPLSPGRVSFNFTGSEALREKLKRVGDLTWHSEPAGRLETVIERLADFFLDRKDPDRRLARKFRLRPP